MDTIWRRTRRFNGQVGVWVEGTKRGDALARLSEETEVYRVQTLGGEGSGEGRKRWLGRLSGMAQDELRSLYERGLEVTLKFPDDREGKAVIVGAGGHVQGIGDTPFD